MQATSAFNNCPVHLYRKQLFPQCRCSNKKYYAAPVFLTLCLTFAYYERSFVNIYLPFSQLNELFMKL